MTFTVRPDRQYLRHNGRSNRYVLVHVEAPAAPPGQQRPPVNVCFVLDRSGSMSGQKIVLARQAVESALARLRVEDRFAIVAYDDVVEVVVESTPASAEAKQNALARLAQVDARGSTDLAGGWLRGCEQVAVHATESTVDRCLLLTDGLANIGMTDPAELERHAEELRARGIATTAFGVGADFDETLLQRMSTAGGGHFYYIETAQQIPDYVTSEVGETLEIVARDVAIAVTAPGVVVAPLSAMGFAPAGDATLIRLGDLVSEQTMDVVVRLEFPFGQVGDEMRAEFRVLDREGVLNGGVQPLTWRYADPATNDGQARDRVVDRAVARLYAARARQGAAALNRQGRYEAARRALQATAERIRMYAGDDAELLAIVAELEQETAVFAAVMAEPSLKRAHASSSYVLQERSAMGVAKRKPATPPD